MGKIKELFIKYKEALLYVFFGGLTTLVNIAVNAVAVNMLSAGGVNTATIPAAIAWIVSVFFAYFTNRKWVFESKKETPFEIAKEMASFFGFRLFSGIIDIVFMYIMVDILGFSNFWMKILSNVVVVILNYFFSKLFIFKKPRNSGLNDSSEVIDDIHKM